MTFRMRAKGHDGQRGMACELRRWQTLPQNKTASRLRQEELETRLIAAPAANWHEAAEKARYVLSHFAGTPTLEDRRRLTLIAAVLADFDRLADSTSGG
jgi:hypothetical protein